jgi:hypothetical protein
LQDCRKYDQGQISGRNPEDVQYHQRLHVIPPSIVVGDFVLMVFLGRKRRLRLRRRTNGLKIDNLITCESLLIGFHRFAGFIFMVLVGQVGVQFFLF